MILLSPRIELDILDNNRTPYQEKDECINESLETSKKVLNNVEKQIKKSIHYRIKEYTYTKHNYVIGQHVILFNPTKKVGEVSKSKRKLHVQINKNEKVLLLPYCRSWYITIG